MHMHPNNWIMRPNNWNYSNLNSRLILVLLAPISPDKLYIKKYGLIWPSFILFCTSPFENFVDNSDSCVDKELSFPGFDIMKHVVLKRHSYCFQLLCRQIFVCNPWVSGHLYHSDLVLNDVRVCFLKLLRINCAIPS